MKNTLKWAKDLEEAGFPQKQAEATVRLLTDIMEDNLATKEDFKELEHLIDQVRAEMNHRFEQLESKLTIKMGTMMAAAVVLMTALDKLL